MQRKRRHLQCFGQVHGLFGSESVIAVALHYSQRASQAHCSRIPLRIWNVEVGKAAQILRCGHVPVPGIDQNLQQFCPVDRCIRLECAVGIPRYHAAFPQRQNRVCVRVPRDIAEWLCCSPQRQYGGGGYQRKKEGSDAHIHKDNGVDLEK